MIIKRLQPRFKDVEVKAEDGSSFFEQVEDGYQVVLKEIPDLIDFEQLQKPTKGVYKKRCIVYTEGGPFIAPYSFQELLEMKNRTSIGFKIPNEKSKRTRRRNVLPRNVKRGNGVLPGKLRDILPEKKKDEESEGL